MKIITIYELLGMIKDGKAPKKIEVTGTIYDFDEEYGFYFTKTKNGRVALGGKLNEINLLYNFNNENVEILEKEKKFTKEDFIKEAMNLEDITREEFNKRYEVKECNCGREYCKGFIKVEKVQEEKKIPENNFNYIYSCEDEHIMANFENIKTTLKDIIDYLKSKGK